RDVRYFISSLFATRRCLLCLVQASWHNYLDHRPSRVGHSSCEVASSWRSPRRSSLGQDTQPALSEPVDFYKGKDIKLIISATVGGGYDVYARALAKHLGEHIPGNPTIIPQNLPPAGGIAAANHKYNVAPRDGTVICLLQNTVAFEPFYANRQAQFDAGLRRTDARDDDRRRGRGLDARVLWPRLQSALQYEGTPDHRLSRTERNPAGVGERRGRSHGLSILV